MAEEEEFKLSDSTSVDTLGEDSTILGLNPGENIQVPWPEFLALIVAAIIKDSSTSGDTETWSIDKIKTSISALINDSSSSSTTETWSINQIKTAIAALVDSAPGALDTLNELAAALGDDPDFATTVLDALSGKESTSNKVGDLSSPSTSTYLHTQGVDNVRSNLQSQITNNSNDIATLNQSVSRRFGRFANKSIVAFGSRGPQVSVFSNGTDTTETSRYVCKSTGNISDVQIYYLYADSINNTTIGTFDDVTIECSVEYPAGTFTKITFNDGNDTKLIKKNFGVLSDLVKIYIPADTIFWIRTNVLVTSGQVWLKNRATAPTTLGVGEGVAIGVNSVMSGTIANSSSYAFGPTAILGVSDTKYGSIFWFGDSIASGQGDSGQMSLGHIESGGYVGRVFGTSWPLMRCNIPGQKAANWQKSSNPVAKFYDEMLSMGQFAISNLGINEIGNGLATMQADAISIWYSQKSRGIKIYQCTLTPRTTSTDGWATLENQTVTSSESARVGYNNWIRDGAPINITTKAAAAVGAVGASIIRIGSVKHPLFGYFETADKVESSRDSGKWDISPEPTTSDGLHPKNKGYERLETAFDTDVFLV